ncbi:MAG TPA: DUF5686 family protein [Chitinophagales bacterium]|nr:DUF5686 family protein [Chitinophagales bacterium]
MPQPTEIYGKVTDAATHEPLPYVNIRFIGSLKGTQTDPKGEYDIRTIERADSISFSFIGYETRTVAIKHGKTQALNIEMGSGALKLTEITVNAGKRVKHRYIDTAANYVFYKVVEHKDENRAEHISSYKYESYDKLQLALLNPSQKLINFFLFKPFRFAFDNIDTTEDGDIFIPGILRESISDVYYRREPRATKKIIKAEILSGIDDPSVGNMASYHFAEIDPYDNLYVMAGISFVAPFAPKAINLYRYYLTDTVKIDGRVSYKLHFVGKVKEDVALKGYAWIDSATWAIKSIVFRPNEKANFNWISDYSIRQDYDLINNRDWLLKREEMRTVGSVLKKKHETSILVTKVHLRKNIQTEINIPDTIFKGLEEEVITDSARSHSRAYWDSMRFEPLSRQEREVYHISDTIKLVRAWKTYEWLGRFFTSSYADAGPVSFGPVLNFVSKNNIEGWRLRFGFETNIRFQHYGTPANKFLRTFYFSAYGAYGLGDKKFQYMGMMRIRLPSHDDHWQALEALYGYDFVVPGQTDEQRFLTFDNIVTLIGGKTLSKIMRVRQFIVSYEKEWTRGFSTIMFINPKTFYDIPGVFDFTRQQGSETLHIHNFNTTEFAIDVRYAYKDLYTVGGFYRHFHTTKYPVLTFRYTAGITNMAGEYFNYHNLKFSLSQRVSSVIGHTNINLRGGKIFGKAPYTTWYLTQGNLGFLLNRLSYNLLNEFEYGGDEYLSLWLEHHFDGFFLNKIPGINRLRLREVIFVKGEFNKFSQRNADVLTPIPTLSYTSPVPYIEAGFGIENILHLFRVDFLWRVTYRHTPGVPNWGIKFAIAPGF